MTALCVQTADVSAALPEFALGCFVYGPTAVASADSRCVPVALRPLGTSAACEWWLGSAPAEMGSQDGFRFAHDGEYLFAHVIVSNEQAQDLEHTTRRLYVHLDTLLRQLGYPHWLRVWNYLARITEGDGDSERYRRFNAGRYGAVALKSGFETNLPAASGVGSLDGGLVIACLAGKQPALPIENPRQISAYRYPRQYGPRAPLFSRAALLPTRAGAKLLVSGTASIVGHESLHPGDAAAQVAETAQNLRALLEESVRQHAPRASLDALRPESLKVYVRDPNDLGVIATQVDRLLGPSSANQYLQAEICRRELLLEIEGTYRLPSGAQ